MEKLDQTTLPPISAFADGLTGGKISITKTEYEELQNAFEQLPEKNMWAMLKYYNDRLVHVIIQVEFIKYCNNIEETFLEWLKPSSN